MSTNSGIILTPTTAPANNWTSVASSADGTKLVATARNSKGGLIYASTNSGLTWALTGAPANNSWATVASSADGSKLVAASGRVVISNDNYDYGHVYTSTNFGMTWTSNNTPDVQWTRVASSADGTRLIAVAIEPGGSIYSSADSGATWISNSVPDEKWISVASSADGDQLVAVWVRGHLSRAPYTLLMRPCRKPARPLPARPGRKPAWPWPTRASPLIC